VRKIIARDFDSPTPGGQGSDLHKRAFRALGSTSLAQNRRSAPCRLTEGGKPRPTGSEGQPGAFGARPVAPILSALDLVTVRTQRLNVRRIPLRAAVGQRTDVVDLGGRASAPSALRFDSQSFRSERAPL